MQRVLIVEDDVPTQEMFGAMLNGSVLLTQVYTLEAARTALASCPYDIVSFDGMVPRSRVDTGRSLDEMLALVSEFRPRSSAVFVAASSHSEYLKRLRASGCDVAVGTKSDLPRLIKSYNGNGGGNVYGR